MISRENIIEKLHSFKVNVVQLDPNGVCNAGCWYCPIKYEKHPPSQNMPIVDVDKILSKIIRQRGKIISPELNNISLVNYNEIVLYPHLEELFDLFKRRNLNFIYIYSNGVAFNKKIIDLVLKYENIFKEIQFNVPAIEQNEWAKQTRFNPKKFNDLIENLNYLSSVITDKLLGVFSIDMNAFSEKKMFKNGGIITKLDNFPDIDFDTYDEHLKIFQEMFPKFKISLNHIMYDRDSLLEENKIFTLNEYVAKKSKGKTIRGCQHSCKTMIDGDMAGRPFGVMSINSFGDLFLCCNDYKERTKFGNILENSIEDVWFSDKHVEMIYEELNNGMCQTCPSAQWK